MICIAFFFLLRPSEYTGTTSDEAAFSLSDVQLYLGTRLLANDSATTHEIKSATSVSLYFTTQKNQIKGDAIAHGHSGHPTCCPVRSAIRRILNHRLHYVEILNPVESTESNLHSWALVTSIRGPNTGPYDRPNCRASPPGGALVNFNCQHFYSQRLSPISTSICTLGAVRAPMWPHSKAYSYLN